MLITVEPHGIFQSNFAYLFFSTLSNHWFANCWQGFTEHHFGRSMSFRENAHNSWTTWYILIQFSIILHEMTNMLSLYSFWHRILINLHSTWAMHITVSWFTLKCIFLACCQFQNLEYVVIVFWNPTYHAFLLCIIKSIIHVKLMLIM